jgi:hypothetical protein
MVTAPKKSLPPTSGTKPSVQRVCIDLPGEAVKCWRSGDHIEVVKRKHRDVIFEINLAKGNGYTVEANKGEFYSPRENLLLKKADFTDGERFHIWIGREFKGELILKSSGKIVGRYPVAGLDPVDYSPDPKIKPEPLLVTLGQKSSASMGTCTVSDPFGLEPLQLSTKPYFDPMFDHLNTLGTQFNYSHVTSAPDIEDYAVITIAKANEIRPAVLKQLENGQTVEDTLDKIFIEPKPGDPPSDLLKAVNVMVSGAMGVVSSNTAKETAGYVLENWRRLNTLSMRVYIERRLKGNYRVLFKGKPLLKAGTQIAGHIFGAERTKKPMGSEASKFIDGGYKRTGKAGHGGVRRIILTAGQNYRSGMKIQVVGTIIDLVVDANTVFGEGGSKDMSEFLGRAGVSLAKAGATAALGSLFAAGVAMLVVAIGGAPVIAVVGLVLAGYILAATIVDIADEHFQVKERVVSMAR